MNMQNNIDPEIVLRDWRTRILNGFLTIAAMAASAGTVATAFDALSHPEQWPSIVFYAVLSLVLVILAVFRKIDNRIRSWGVLLVAFVTGLTTLATLGLGGSGRLYLLSLPIIALILLGVRSGMFMSVVSILTMAVFAFLAEYTRILQPLISERNSLQLADWLAEGSDTLMLLIVVMALLVLFYRFQVRLIADERRAQAELLQTKALLEQQNVTLEQKVQERTGELQSSNNNLEQRNAEMALLNSVSEAMVKTLDVKTMTRLVGDKMREVFRADSVLIMLLDQQTNLINVPYEYDRNEGGYLDYVEPFPLGTGLSSKVISTGQPLMLGTLEEEQANGAYFPPEIIEKGAGELSQSWLGVPIIANDRVLGLVALSDIRQHAFNDNHSRLLQTLSANMGMAIEKARLFQAEQQRVAELATVNNIQEILASNLDIDTMYELIGENIKTVFNVQVVDIVTYDPATNLITMHYSYEKGDRSVIPPRQPFGFRLHVLDSGQPLLVNRDFVRLAEAYDNPLLSGEWPKSVLFVPLLVEGKARGVISIQDLDQEKAFSQADVRLLQTLASSMSVALENARLFNETQRLLKETEQRNNDLAILNSVSEAMSKTLDFKMVTKIVGDKVREIFNVEIAEILLLDKTTNLIHCSYSYYTKYIEYEPFPLGEGITSKIIETRQPILIGTSQDELAKESVVVSDEDDTESYLGVPIIAGEQVIGVVSIQSYKQHAYNENHVRLLQTLASNMGITLENARLFDEAQRLLKETEQRAIELATINTISRELAGELGLQPLIHLVGEQMRAVFHADIAYVALLDERCNIVNFPYTHGEEFLPLNYGEGLTSKIIQTGEPLLINQEMDRQTLNLGATIIGKQALSYLGVPIFVGGKAVGVISVQSTEREGVFNIHDENLLSTLAANVGTALHNAQLFDELHESAEKLRLIFESAFDGIDIYEEFPSTGQRILVDCNERYCELAGRSREELMSVENTGIFQRSIANPWDQEGDSILKRKAFSGVFSWIRPDGKENIVEYNAAPTKVGERYFTIGIDRDVTEHMRVQDELKKARAAAEQANQAKSAFLANMSHELRTPLNAIVGFTRIVRRKSEGLLPEKQTENLDKVLLSAEHLLNLINTVLDIAKIEAGRMDVLAANFRIAALIDLCANTTQPLLRPTVTLEKQVDEQLNIVYSDQDKIRQIVLNLLSNAAKFTHAGKITLAAMQDGENLRISVADTGIGISDEALPRIFKEFQQADTSTTRQYGGTGLGLSISRNLARLLGGDLNVESELGKGSTFTLVIPLQYRSKTTQPLEATPESARHAPAAVSEPGLHPAPASAKKRVLVIDDDPDAVYLLQESLNPHEFEINGTRNGHDGLRQAREQHPQAILLDIIMPGADGWQVLHDLKEDPATANIPVILLTILDKKALGFRLGAAAYLLKPLDPVAVREALNKVICQDDRQQKHVLVVDDDPNIAEMLRQFLPEAEFKLDSAPDGVAGLEAIAASRPDILLLDIIMPRLDGFGVIESLRADPATRDLPIIVISAKELTAAESARLKESVTLVMKKQGFQGEKLVDEINSVLK